MTEHAPGLTETLTALRAAGEETRLRILILLTYGELTVTELTDILGQSQPRISRHLKLLMEAGIVERMREGAWAFFRIADQHPVLRLMRDMLVSLNQEDPVLMRDSERFDAARQQRIQNAQEYFSKQAHEWDKLRSLQAPATLVEKTILDMVKGYPVFNFVDLGTGTGKMIELFAPHVSYLAGLDSNHAMLGVARSNFYQAGINNVDLRQADIYAPSFPSGFFNLAMIHQVLHYLDDPARAIREAARLLAPSGLLMIVDFAPHDLEFLRLEQNHRRLGFSHEQMASWITDACLDNIAVRDIPPQQESTERLTVTIWLARDRRIITDAPETNSTLQGIV